MANTVEIPNVSAAQLVGATRIPLANGTLKLEPAAASLSSDSSIAKLLLSIGTLTLPLGSSTIVGTSTNSSRTYLITLPLPSSTAVPTGFLEVTLPPTVDQEGSAENQAATVFEALLVEHRFLTAGLVADADDMVRTVKESAARTAEKISGKAQERVEGREQVEPWEETKYPDSAKKVGGVVLEGMDKTAEATGKITGGISSAAVGAGEWVGQKFGGGGSDVNEERSLPVEAVKQTIDATDMVFEGVGQSAAHVAGSVGQGASDIAEHEHGQEAKNLVEGGRTAAGDVGKVASDVILGTSAVVHGAELGAGVAKGGTQESSSDK